MGLESEPVVEVWRYPILESRHRVSAAVVAADGRLLAYLGSPDLVTTMRSSAKPLQAIPVVETGAADALDLSERELAICCASHSGEPIHREAASSILSKAGLDESALRCGVHWPGDRASADQLRAEGREPTPIYNNCSGKHSGMLAQTVFMGEPVENYEAPDHPAQRRIREVMGAFSGVPAAEIPAGTDGCSVPTFGLPLRAIALAFARLADPDYAFPDNPTRIAACHRITDAMRHHPEMIAGTSNHLDTQLMRTAGDRLFAKGGAEGLACAGILPNAERSPRNGRGIGIAIKIEDGDLRRVRDIVMVELLRQLGILSENDLESLATFRQRKITNHRGLPVGEAKPNFKLKVES